MYDIIIVGGGPAGMTAAIYALRANKKVLILEKESIGGNMSIAPLIENYPGFKSITGVELAMNLYNQVIDLKGNFEIEEVLEVKNGDKKIVITDMNEYKTKSIILATGASHKILGIDREDELLGSGISYCASCDGAFFKDEVIGIVGGGSSAVINAITLSEFCKKVYLIVRKDKLRAEQNLIEQLNLKSNIEVLYNSQVKTLLGKTELERVEIEKNKQILKLDLKGLFISIGMIPKNKFVENIIELDEYGYVKDNNDSITNISGIFVAGDCRAKNVRQITTATADGTIAAINAIEYVNSLK